MSAFAPVSLSSETYEASSDEAIARVHDFLAAHEAAGRPTPTARYFLAGSGPRDQVELPEEIYLVLRQVVEAMQRGLSVTISPTSRTLTTQQAADLLGITRVTLVKLLEEKKIPFERIGTHRRVKLSDVLAFREARKSEQYAALESLSAGVDDDIPVEEVLDELRAARKAVAAQRRASR